MVEIEFGDLPEGPTGGSKYQHDEIVEALMARPGQWAKAYPDAPTSLGSNIRSGKVSAYTPTDHFEVAVRNSKNYRGEVWVRYIGESGEGLL